MYLSLDPTAIGLSGRQSELIELALTYNFTGLELNVAELLQRTENYGVEETGRYLASAPIRLGGFCLPFDPAAADAAFEKSMGQLSKIAETAHQLGADRCTYQLPAASEIDPYQELFEKHRTRLGRVGELLAQNGIRFGIGFNAAADLRGADGKQYVHTTEEYLTLWRAINSEYVGLALDLWDWQVGGASWEKLSEISGPHVATLRISEPPADADLANLDDEQRLLPDEAQVERLGVLLTRFNSENYDGPVTLNPHPARLNGETRDSNVKRCSDTLDAIWRAAGIPRPTIKLSVKGRHLSG